MKQDKNLGLKTILNELKRKLIWIILATIIGGAAMCGYSSFMIAPMYQARASIYVYSDTFRVEGIVTSAELSASQQLAETCRVIIASDRILDNVQEIIDNERSAAQMKNNITVSSANGTEILNIFVQDTDPEMAQEIANTLLAVLPGEIVRIVKAGDVKVIDEAKIPQSPISPNITNYTIAGALFGLLFSCGVIVLRSALFTKIRNEEDLEAYFDEPILGIVPTIKYTRGESNE